MKANLPKMTPASNDKPSQATVQHATTSPTRPGWYWWKRDGESWEIMVLVRFTNGELTVWWPNRNVPVAKLKGHWRGPIPPSTGPGSPTSS